MKTTNRILRLTLIGASALSLALSALADGSAGHALLPVAGSLRGGFGSNFKTAAQLHNRTDRAAKGKIVFHPANQPASANDPVISYDLEPRATINYSDIVDSLGVQGIGSIDVLASEGAIPAVVARAYDDKPEGTNGTAVPLVDSRDALVAGEHASLIAPGDSTRFRFNIGIRTLSSGAAVKITVWSDEGFERSSTVRTFGADLFQQQAAAEFVFGTVAANDSIEVEILSGAAVLYGTTTDNTTNDPAFQLAARDAVVTETPTLGQ
jgi:hypothetical protein